MDFTLGDCLLVAVKLTKNVDHEQYGYSDSGIGLDPRSQLVLPIFGWIREL